MTFNQQSMDSAIDQLLEHGEKSLCPVYCLFKKTGLLASNKTVQLGFATCTDGNRFLTLRAFPLIGRLSPEVYYLDGVSSLVVTKNLFGQYIINAVFSNEEEKQRLRFQVGLKVAGGGFPDQRENLERMLSILEKYKG